MKLFTPGPTPVLPEVLQAMAEPMIHHRSEEFAKILESVRKDLAWLCGTSQGEVVLFTSSGSGGMEAVISSLFSPQDEVVVVVGGKFGERWEALAKQYQLAVKVVAVEWGRAVTVDAVLASISSRTRGVLIQACESSTGVNHPVRQLGQALCQHPQILFVVDGITGLGVFDLDMDRDHVDVLVCGSQKALMTPPGLATVTLSPRAVQACSATESRSPYFSLQTELTCERKRTTSFTPAVSLFRGLCVALEAIRREGKESIFARTRLMQAMTRKAFREMGLTLFNPDEEATQGITVVRTPQGMNVKNWLTELKEEEGLWLAGGQAELAGRIFRISHMGAIQPNDLLEAFEIIERRLAPFLPQAKSGIAVATARKVMEGSL